MQLNRRQPSRANDLCTDPHTTDRFLQHMSPAWRRVRMALAKASLWAALIARRRARSFPSP